MKTPSTLKDKTSKETSRHDHEYDEHGHAHHEHDQHHHDDAHQHHDPEHHDHDDEHGHEHPAGPVEYIRLGLLALVIIASLTGWWKNFMSRDWLAFAATLIGGFPIFEEAWENLRKRRMTMELSMTIALASALAIGEFFTALVIVLFVLIAEVGIGVSAVAAGSAFFIRKKAPVAVASAALPKAASSAGG